MTDDARRLHDADDAKLLNKVRAGDTSAFSELTSRHERPASRMAAQLAGAAAESGELVVQACGRVRTATQRGGGPTDAFRPYLLAAVYRCWDDRRSPATAAEWDHSDPGAPLLAAGTAAPLLAQAFVSLPARWMAALWHTEIEPASPAELDRILGLNRNAVAALRRRAKDGLRQAYLQLYAAQQPDCASHTTRLGTFLRDAGSGRDSAAVTEHLSQCEQCRAVYTELADLSLALPTVVAPLFLGEVAAAYLADADPASPAPAAAAAGSAGTGSPATVTEDALTTAGTTTASTTTAGAGVAAGSALAAAGGPAWLRLPDWPPGKPARWVAAGAGAVLVVGATVLAVTLTSQSTPAAAQQSASPPAAVATPASPAPSPSTAVPAAKPRHRRHRHAAFAPAAPALVTSSAPPPPPAVQLAASVSVSPLRRSSTVGFAVSDTGTAATGTVTVSVALPAGSSAIGGLGPHGTSASARETGVSGFGNGWYCQPTPAGATCQHSSIPAGGQAQGSLFVIVYSSAACGQAVSITATTGNASASAESAGGLQCGSGAPGLPGR